MLQDYGNEPGREFPDILNLNLQLANFLGEKESKVFCKQLWSLILEASNEPDGIPAVFKEKKEKPTIVQKNEESESTQKTRTKRQTIIEALLLCPTWIGNLEQLSTGNMNIDIPQQQQQHQIPNTDTGLELIEIETNQYIEEGISFDNCVVLLI